MSENNAAKPKSRRKQWIVGASGAVVLTAGLLGWNQYRNVKIWSTSYIDYSESLLPRLTGTLESLNLMRISDMPGKMAVMGSGNRMDERINALIAEEDNAFYYNRPALAGHLLSEARRDCLDKLDQALSAELTFLKDTSSSQYTTLDAGAHFFALHDKSVSQLSDCIAQTSNGKPYAATSRTDSNTVADASAPDQMAGAPVTDDHSAAEASAPTTTPAQQQVSSNVTSQQAREDELDSEANLKQVSYPEQVDVPLDFSPLFKAARPDCASTLYNATGRILTYADEGKAASLAIQDNQQRLERVGINVTPFVSQLYAVAYRTGGVSIASMGEASDYMLQKCQAAIKGQGQR